MTLYEISDEYLELIQMAEDPDVDPETLRDTMEAIEGEFEDKVEGYVVTIKEIEGNIDKYKKEIDRLTRIVKTCENSIGNMKTVMLSTMDVLELPKVQTEHFRVSKQKNGGLQPLWIDPNLDDIPEEYIIRKPYADTTKIREALKTGAELSFAHLEERGIHLAIR